jgi:mono/diheme cytochrome c family protein
MTCRRLGSQRAVCVMMVAAIAGVAAAASQVHERDPSWSAPRAADARVNPLATRPDAAAGGRKLFEQRCAACHNGDARGTKKGPDLTAPAVQSQSDGALFWKITQGNTRGGMPTFSFLPELQRWQLVLYLKAIPTASSQVRPGDRR